MPTRLEQENARLRKRVEALENVRDVSGNPVEGLQNREAILFDEKSTDSQRRVAYFEIMNLVVISWHNRVQELTEQLERGAAYQQQATLF